MTAPDTPRVVDIHLAAFPGFLLDPSAQGRGMGRALVEAFLAEAGRRGAMRVDLTTDKVDNEVANVFYARLGFRVAREVVTPEGRVLNEPVIDL